MSGNGFPKLCRFCALSGGVSARIGRILLCVVIAPFVGARIETARFWIADYKDKIAPFVGARIETNTIETTCTNGNIAPFVGARIETDWLYCYVYSFCNRTLHGCAD